MIGSWLSGLGSRIQTAVRIPLTTVTVHAMVGALAFQECTDGADNERHLCRSHRVAKSAWTCCCDISRNTPIPGGEKYGLVAQLRRAAVSVPDNIAEGKGRFSDKEWRSEERRVGKGGSDQIETWI